MDRQSDSSQPEATKSVTEAQLPRWLELQFEIDYWYWVLEQMYDWVKSRSVLDRMIDQSTGFEKHKEKEAVYVMNKIRELRAEYEKLTQGSDLVDEDRADSAGVSNPQKEQP